MRLHTLLLLLHVRQTLAHARKLNARGSPTRSLESHGWQFEDSYLQKQLALPDGPATIPFPRRITDGCPPSSSIQKDDGKKVRAQDSPRPQTKTAGLDTQTKNPLIWTRIMKEHEQQVQVAKLKAQQGGRNMSPSQSTGKTSPTSSFEGLRTKKKPLKKTSSVRAKLGGVHSGHVRKAVGKRRKMAHDVNWSDSVSYSSSSLPVASRKAFKNPSKYYLTPEEAGVSPEDFRSDMLRKSQSPYKDEPLRFKSPPLTGIKRSRKQVNYRESPATSGDGTSKSWTPSTGDRKKKAPSGEGSDLNKVMERLRTSSSDHTTSPEITSQSAWRSHRQNSGTAAAALVKHSSKSASKQDKEGEDPEATMAALRLVNLSKDSRQYGDTTGAGQMRNERSSSADLNEWPRDPRLARPGTLSSPAELDPQSRVSPPPELASKTPPQYRIVKWQEPVEKPVEKSFEKLGR